MSNIDENWKKYYELEQLKRERNIPRYRSTGRTTRLIFELASNTPDGDIYFISGNAVQNRHAYQLFVDLLNYTGAPIVLSGNNHVIMGRTRYRFTNNAQRKPGFLESLKPDTIVIYNHSMI